MDNYIVYIHTNKLNGKKYVGITSQTPNERWRNGNGYKGSTYFYNAIQKYGWNNFEHEIYKSNLSKEKACDLEVRLIAELKTNNEEFGYNLDSGGSCGKHSEFTKNKLKQMFTGRTFSNETIENMKRAAKIRGGHLCTNETKQKISKSKLGHPVSEDTKEKLRKAFSKPILCIETGKIFSSITEAANSINLSKASISSVINGRNKTAGGYHWKLCDNN